MSVLLSPLGNGFQFFTTTGLPLNGGLLYTYQAGSSTPLTTYSDNQGLIPNANPVVLGVDGRPQTEIWLTQGFSYKFVLTDSNYNQIQTYDNLYGILQTAPAVSGTVPSGLIAIWSGSVGSIPSGWVLCNGQNGTPDLRNSFILGAGNSYSVGQTGGTSSITLTQSNLPSVNFTVTDSGHSHSASSSSSVSDPGHSHGIGYISTNIIGSYPAGSISSSGYQPLSSGNTNTAFTGISVSTSTSLSSATTGISVSSGGSGAAVTTLPPYYALAFIQKT